MQVLSALLRAFLFCFDFFSSKLARIESNFVSLLKYKTPFALIREGRPQSLTLMALESNLAPLIPMLKKYLIGCIGVSIYIWQGIAFSHDSTWGCGAAFAGPDALSSCYSYYSPRVYQFSIDHCTYASSLYKEEGTTCFINAIINGDVKNAGSFAYSINPTCSYSPTNLPGTCTQTSSYKQKQCPSTNSPIVFATGNKILNEHDLGSAQSDEDTLGFSRYFNDDLIRMGGPRISNHWTYSYSRWLQLSGTTTIYVYRSDGSMYVANSPGTPTVAGLRRWSTDSDVNFQVYAQIDTYLSISGWVVITPASTHETYDAKGVLLSIAGISGNTLTPTYSDGTAGANGGYILDANWVATSTILPAGQLIRMTDSSGRVLLFSYSINLQLVQVTDPSGLNYRYTYGSSGNLSTVTYPDGKTKTYLYGETAYTSGASLPHALTGIIDENGVRYATYRYDSTGRAYDEDHGGSVDHYNLAYSTDTSGNPVSTTVTDPLGTARTYNFTTALGVVKSTGTSQPGGSGCGAASSGITYDANGNISSRTDFNGNTTTYAYDMARNLETSRTEASGTPLARTISTTWHPTFRLPTQITEPGRVTNFSYDAATGNVLSKSITDSASGKTRTWTYTYTTAADGTLPALLKIVDGPRTDVADVTSYAYYPNGDLKTITNALGHVTQITQYDPNGRPATIVDPNGLTTTLSYWPRGWLHTRTVGVETTTYDYDNVGQLTQVTPPDGRITYYHYDDAHRLTSIIDAQGNHIDYTLDNIGNRVQENVYDNLGNLVQTQSRAFDALNRLWKEIGAYNQTTLYTYNPNGNLTSVTDPLSHTTVNGYDALNRLTQASDAAGSITRYGYDPLDQLRSITDPRGLVTNYSVNALGDQTQITSPDTGVTGNTYDAASNLATRTDANGDTTYYTYDALNRVTKISYSAPSFPPIVLHYDSGPNALGRLSKMSDESGSTTWTYNAQGRVASKTQLVNGVSQSLSYGYDTAGRLTSLTYPSGKVLSYGYDAQGRVSGISVNGTPLLSSITYQAFGQAKSWTWGNGQTYARSFDQDGRLTSYPLGSNLRALAFDAASRIGGITDTIPAANQSLGYDNLDRLTSWVAPSTNQSYAYDANGNRTSLTIGASPYAYTVNPGSNRLQSVAGPTPKTYSYDAAGHVTGNGSRSYLYEPAGFMYASLPASWPNPDVGFWRNGLGQRLIKTAAGVSTLYVYDGNARLIGEYGGTGAALQETIYLGDQPVPTGYGLTITSARTWRSAASHLCRN